MTDRRTEATVVVAGHLMVDPDARDDYLAGCLDPGRVNVYERWVSRAAVEAFRGSGPSDDQGAALLSASVAEYDVAGERFLT